MTAAQVAPDGGYVNMSGCGNSLNSDHPVVRQFIIDTLRYWVRGFPSPLLASLLLHSHVCCCYSCETTRITLSGGDIPVPEAPLTVAELN